MNAPTGFRLIPPLAAILFSGAIFGFFYAWVCSTMWGLDRADPRVAIVAMQAMNASVRNPVFFPAFFLTPVVLAGAAVFARFENNRAAMAGFAAAAVVYFCGGLLPTVLVNVPMNEALAVTAVPDDAAAAEAIWTDYSARWQFWNLLRTIASALALMLAAYGLLATRPAATRQAV